MKVIPIAVFLLFFQPLQAQYNWGELDRELSAKQQLLGNNVVALVWKDDSLIYKKEMGSFNSSTRAPIASCSKWLTAALVLQFVDEGRLSLEDKVAKYIPSFNKESKNGITIRECLSHMTGITDDDKFLRRILQRRKFASLEEEVNDFAARENRAAPGTDFWYGNVGLNIAGRILEIISKQDFETIAQAKLFGPLQMTHTTFLSTNDKSPVNPSGGAQSTADDYMKFLVMLLNKGQYKGKQVLSENAIAQMRIVQDSPGQIRYAPKAAEGYTYALGNWVIESSRATYFPGKLGGSNPPPPTNEPYQTNAVATVLACPGLFGTWPMIDYCRGYAYIVFVKNLLGEERANAHEAIRKIIDKQIKNSCQ